MPSPRKTTIAKMPYWFGSGPAVHFFARNGRVFYENQDPDADPSTRIGSMDWRTARRRLRSLLGMMFQSSEWRTIGAEREKMKLFVSDMGDVLTEAQEQEAAMPAVAQINAEQDLQRSQRRAIYNKAAKNPLS